MTEKRNDDGLLFLFDLKKCIGWQGNLERQNRGVVMAPSAPVLEASMKR